MVNTNLDTTPLPPNNLVAQDPQSKELAGYVRTKTFGRDVREAIARSIELNSTRSKSAEILANETVNVANDLTDRFNQQIGALTEDSEVIDARGGKATLGQRLDETEAQTVKKGYFLKLEENIELGFKERTSSDYYAMYDSLLSDTRMKKRYMGYDQSGEYQTNLYIYQPANFKRTIFVTCAIHGWEHYGTLVMYEVLTRILDENISAQYTELRNTRILVIPVANPWGMNQESDQAIRRGNSRGVDLNRNFDYKWSENTGAFGLTKGEEPFSEAESKIIKQVLEEYVIDSYIDLHNFVNQETETRDYLFYGNEKIKNNTNQLVQWLENQYDGVNISHIVAANDSSANNYAIEVLNIPAINIELIRGRHGSDDDRRWVELMLNYLKLQSDTYTMISNLDYGLKSRVAPQFKIADRPITSEMTNIHELNYTYNIDTDGIFMVNGFVTFEITSDEMAIVTIIPTIEQDRELKSLDMNSPYISKPFMKVGKGTYTMPINTMVHVRRVNGDAHFRCGIIVEGTGTSVIKRVQANYVFLPGTLTDATSGQHVPYKYS